MEAQINSNKEKISYEDLNNVAIQLSKENQYLKTQLQSAAETLNTINRLDYLFKVLEQGTYFDRQFINKCTEEIMRAMTSPEKSEESKKD